MKGKNLMLIVGAVAVAGAAYYLFFKKPKTGEKTSNAEGTMRTVGPCQGSMATQANCQNYCEDRLNGTYDQSSRTCTYGGSAAPGPLFGGMRVITGRKIIKA